MVGAFHFLSCKKRLYIEKRDYVYKKKVIFVPEINKIIKFIENIKLIKSEQKKNKNLFGESVVRKFQLFYFNFFFLT